MVRALGDSMNLATVNLGMALGLPTVIETLRDLGVDGEVPAEDRKDESTPL